MDFHTWLIFMGVWIAAGIPLGPNAVNCIAVSSTAGFKNALWGVVGILLAALCFIAAVSAGLATVLVANAYLFTVLKLCGGAYLIWMGFALWRKSGRIEFNGADQRAKTPFQITRAAFLISLSNPKAILAYGAVFSQFVDPARPLGGQLAILVPTAQCITAVIYICYSGLGTGIRRYLQSARRRLIFNRTIAGFYIFAGGSLITAEAMDIATPTPAR
ncbi:LysE family translocator [Rhodospirillaceae bacterium KN72]|uniref:LysE family translocator n=1 Tax=Pacificispira spongiicola TaxID=2729598 RepID=A0A7Y0E0S4_9PROT|nr:LysE family translocator [Pacificispira spongiicola]NMM45101.1 LysE family translocator [Pacificispira spongiicola]